MSHTAFLENLVLDSIKSGAVSCRTIGKGAVAQEAVRIATEQKRDASRVLDKALQALRRKGKIKFAGRPAHWQVCDGN